MICWNIQIIIFEHKNVIADKIPPRLILITTMALIKIGTVTVIKLIN